MNASTNNARPVTPIATTFACAGALLNAAQVMLRRLGFTEVGNDSLSMVVADLSRIESVLVGRANGAQHGAPAPVVSPSPAVSMPEFAPIMNPLHNVPYRCEQCGDVRDPAPCYLYCKPCRAELAESVAPRCTPVDPVTPDDDDEFDGPNTVECDDDVSTVEAPVVCGKCKGKGTWRFGRPCPECGAPKQVAAAQATLASPVAVPTVAANKPVAAAPAPQAPVEAGATRPSPNGRYAVLAYCVRCHRPGSMPTKKPFTVDQPRVDQSCFMCTTHADERDAAPTTMSQKPAAQPVLRQGNSSAPLNAPAPAPKSNKTAAPSPAKPAGKPTPVAPAPLPVAPPANANGVNTDHVNRATEALDKGSLKALALACAIIGLEAKASDGAKVMREALADWLLANDDVDADDEQGSEPVAAVAPVASKPAPVVKPAAPARKPAAAPKTVDTSSTGGLPLNQWRMLLAVESAEGAPLTYAQIRDMLIGEYDVDYYSGMTAALRAGSKYPNSLSNRGLVTESLVEIDGNSKPAFAITAAGKAIVAKHS